MQGARPRGSKPAEAGHVDHLLDSYSSCRRAGRAHWGTHGALSATHGRSPGASYCPGVAPCASRQGVAADLDRVGLQDHPGRGCRWRPARTASGESTTAARAAPGGRGASARYVAMVRAAGRAGRTLCRLDTEYLLAAEFLLAFERLFGGDYSTRPRAVLCLPAACWLRRGAADPAGAGAVRSCRHSFSRQLPAKPARPGAAPERSIRPNPGRIAPAFACDRQTPRIVAVQTGRRRCGRPRRRHLP